VFNLLNFKPHFFADLFICWFWGDCDWGCHAEYI
jgi:hypothetical protein